MFSLDDFDFGDLIEITERDKQGTRIRQAEVTNVNYNNNGLVTYRTTGGGQGAFDPIEIGTKPYGFVVALRKLEGKGEWSKAFDRFHSSRSSLYRNPAYDLMHDPDPRYFR